MVDKRGILFYNWRYLIAFLCPFGVLTQLCACGFIFCLIEQRNAVSVIRFVLTKLLRPILAYLIILFTQ